MPPTAAETERASRGAAHSGAARRPRSCSEHEQAAAAAERRERHSGHFHARAGGPRVGLGAARAAPRRRHADAQPVRHQGRRGWKGAVAEVTTTEYVNGEPRRLVQRFRAYASPAESFADYAALMKSQPRYQAVRDAGSDARAFATRPAARGLRHRSLVCRQS